MDPASSPPSRSPPDNVGARNHQSSLEKAPADIGRQVHGIAEGLLFGGRPRGKRTAVDIASMGDDLGTAVGVTRAHARHRTANFIAGTRQRSSIANLRNNPMHSTGDLTISS